MASTSEGDICSLRKTNNASKNGIYNGLCEMCVYTIDGSTLCEKAILDIENETASKFIEAELKKLNQSQRLVENLSKKTEI